MEGIGRHQYNMLKKLSNLTQDQTKAIEEYEAKRAGDKEASKREREYWEKVNTPPEEKAEPIITKTGLWEDFKTAFLALTGRDWVNTPETRKNAAIALSYFLKDDRFFEMDGVNDFSNPSFEKGLLILGGNGCGKTSMMKAFSLALQPWKLKRFFVHSCEAMSKEYERLEEAHEKGGYWDKYLNGNAYFDDLAKEDIAKNYGLTNIMRYILIEREQRKWITHASMNFRNEYPNDVNAAMGYIAERYGTDVYDRIATLFNVVAFTGKSFRR